MMSINIGDETLDRLEELVGDNAEVVAYEAIEDALDLIEAEKIWADVESGKERLVPFDEVARHLGLED
ncbi:hypothetical protein DDD64_06960 [Actinotignum sanguinis]|uniref:hypothetical protein n=2 Tax=Actinotignum sanguinis TaxID=1445614 RepID=UPI000F7E7D48|nr:hypothetical protein [Actinotignum sanguinis]MDY5148691.1 hypothetical protein [Actinotignum sanguinis]RTE48354.1 hypothetical protein DDD64_06960 [Actinotignum sanguinis]